VQQIALPLMDAVTTYGGIVSRVEAATIHAQWMRERADEYGIHISGRMYGGYAIPATYYVEALIPIRDVADSRGWAIPESA
jgi:aspartyl-tRNA(Asn)/glutamyl-tRNA(Gln) amidotransferase subunit A